MSKTVIVDKILDKISANGISSLKTAERMFLDKYSKDQAIEEELLNALSISSGTKFKSLEYITFSYENSIVFGEEIHHSGTLTFNGMTFHGSIIFYMQEKEVGFVFENEDYFDIEHYIKHDFELTMLYDFFKDLHEKFKLLV